MPASTDPLRILVTGGTGTLGRTFRAAAEGAEHLVYPSIVGIDRVPYRYYEAKLAAEEAAAHLLERMEAGPGASGRAGSPPPTGRWGR